MENSIHLVALGVAVAGLLADLVAVGLTNAAGFVRPGVPDVGIQVMDVIGALLVDPEDLIQSGLPVDGAELQNGQLAIPEVIVLGDTEDLAGMGGFAVLPLGPDVQPLITEGRRQDVFAELHELGVRRGPSVHRAGIIPSIVGEIHEKYLVS